MLRHQQYQESLNLILGPDPSSDGIWSETEILELQEKQRQQVRIAGEQAIQNVAPGDPLGQQEIRHNNATAYAANVSNQNDNLSFVVPSGNFGNIYSARIAKHMGLPINKLHVVTNQNDMLHKCISLGEIRIQNVQQTFSPSMDIQISSNFERQIFESLDYDSEKVKTIMNILSNNRDYKFDEKTKKIFKIFTNHIQFQMKKH